MPNEAPLTVLPTPYEKEVEDFIGLYHQKYEVELIPVDAHRLFAGLMRFLYLTSTDSPESVEKQEPSHTTQLTLRKGGQSRKKA